MPIRLARIVAAGWFLAAAGCAQGQTTSSTYIATTVRAATSGTSAVTAASAAADGSETTALPSTVSVFLPGYGGKDWSAYRGSIVGSDSAATTYTIFCGESNDSSPSCLLDADLPLTFAEGPSTLRYEGTLSGEITAHLSCSLKGKTAATCTGSSSYGTGYREGPITGPLATVWTKTLAASDIEWGVLSLTTPPVTAATTDLQDGATTPTIDPSYYTGTGPAPVTPTKSGGVAAAHGNGPRWAVFGPLFCAAGALILL